MALLDFEKTMKLLEQYGIRFSEYGIAESPGEAVKLAKNLGYPVALKVLSHKVVHKSDVGAVKLNLEDEKEVKAAYSKIVKAVGKSKVEGMIVQRMAPEGVELLVGGKQDVQFGPVVAFGLGGIFVEIFEDVSLRICPIDHEEARRMIREIKGYPILKGARGTEPVDVEALIELLVKVSKLMNENRIKELDLNPIIAYPKAYLAVDARIIK